MRSEDVLGKATLALVGAGAMAEAVIGGMLGNHIVAPDAVTATHPRAKRVEELRERYGVHASQDNCAAAQRADIVVLAVKPQMLQAVLAELHGLIRRDALVISVIAGARIDTLTTGLGHAAVVRSMPNTPGQIGEGMTVWTATDAVSEVQRQQTRLILRALGHQLYVKDERFLDMATAVSGTGPAYVFLFMEALIDAAVHLGVSRADARELVVHTVRGAGAYALKTPVHPAEMRNLVTSPGGTSAAALYELEKGGFRTVLSKAVWAAYQRSVALGATNREAPKRDAGSGRSGRRA
jgi:pyrroline-5-carboxylate reductase